MESKENKRGSFSKIGFILSAAGSSIGLGNLWKFPYITGSNGGGIFVVVYLIILVTIGFACTLGEITIGKYAKTSPVGAYDKIAKKFKFNGYLGIIVPFFICTYYNIIGGWVLRYIFSFITGKLGLMSQASDTYFNAFITSSFAPIFWTFVFVAINFIIIRAGIQEGIEKASKILMPALFVLLVVVAIRSVTLPGAMEGIKFYLKPDITKLNLNTVSAALGQVFFSLSLGMGIMITYGSYLSDETNLERSAVVVPLLDTLAALLAGFAILPAVFAFGFEPTAGPGLIFITLPSVFASMPLGSLWAALFFILVFFASITSSISLMECPTAWMIDEKKWDRKKATLLICVLMFLIAIPESLSLGVMSGVKFPPFGHNLFDFIGYISESILMPFAGFIMSIVIGHVWGVENFEKVITNNGQREWKTKGFFTVLIKYIVPVAIFFVWLNSIGLFQLLKG
jgi:NSS family neurotransmitter:Na+ symporter